MMSDTTNENRRKNDARPARALTWTDPAPAAAHLGDAMTDIETMGTAPGSAILSIGAVTFGPAGLGDEFYAPIALASCTQVGLTIDPVTVAWWMKQSDAARAAAICDNAEPLPVVLQQFTRWFELVEAERLWCQGANFDAPLLEAAYRACGMTPPWKFWNVRDTRTLYEQADVKVDRARGVHHNALDDARAQAEAAVVALQRLQDARQQASVSEEATCTCPSGDGSLRWPCPAHPTESASGSDGTAAAGAGDLPVDVEFKRLADTILQATTNGTRLEALRGMAELFDRAAATSGSDGTAAAGAGGLDASSPLPCPFCAGRAEHYFLTGTSFGFKTRCTKCGVHLFTATEIGSTDKDAATRNIAAWNNRAPATSGSDETQSVKVASDISADYHYLLGLRAGWNLGQSNDNVGFNAAVAARQNDISEAKAELRAVAAQQSVKVDERALFEAWAKSQGNRRGRKGDGYSTEYTQRAWLAWQARAALAQQAAPVAPAGFEEAIGAWLSARDYWQDDQNEHVKAAWSNVLKFAAPATQQAGAAVVQARWKDCENVWSDIDEEKHAQLSTSPNYVIRTLYPAAALDTPVDKTTASACVKPRGWIVGDTFYHRLDAAQRECDRHNEYERSRPDSGADDLRSPEPVYAAPAPSRDAASDAPAAEDVRHHALCERKGHNPLCAGCDAEEVRELEHGHREDFYMLANARRLIESPRYETHRMTNWVLASRLFATGSNSARQICYDAGIDPEGYTVDRAAMSASQGKTEEAK